MKIMQDNSVQVRNVNFEAYKIPKSGDSVKELKAVLKRAKCGELLNDFLNEMSPNQQKSVVNHFLNSGINMDDVFLTREELSKLSKIPNAPESEAFLTGLVKICKDAKEISQYQIRLFQEATQRYLNAVEEMFIA